MPCTEWKPMIVVFSPPSPSWPSASVLGRDFRSCKQSRMWESSKWLADTSLWNLVNVGGGGEWNVMSHNRISVQLLAKLSVGAHAQHPAAVCHINWHPEKNRSCRSEGVRNMRDVYQCQSPPPVCFVVSQFHIRLLKLKFKWGKKGPLNLHRKDGSRLWSNKCAALASGISAFSGFQIFIHSMAPYACP